MTNNNKDLKDKLIHDDIKKNIGNLPLPTRIEGIRLSKSEMKANRVRICAQEILYGASPYMITTKYTTEWALAEATILGYITEANHMIRDSVESNPEMVKLDIMAKYGELFRLNMNNGNLKDAKSVLDSITKLTQAMLVNVSIEDNRVETIRLVEVLKDKDQDDDIDIRLDEIN